MNWLRNCWQVAAYAGEIGSGLLARTFLGEDVVLFRDTAGAPHALADRCAHRCLPLSKGRLLGDIVQCGYHGMRFHPDGSCDGVPGQDTIPPKAIVPAYPVAERHGFVWIWMGERSAADPALVPDAFWFANPAAWATATGYHHIAAEYRLLVDNLLDLSHESFVHTDTIGNGAVADSPVTAQLVDGRVKVHRFMANTPPPPFYCDDHGRRDEHRSLAHDVLRSTGNRDHRERLDACRNGYRSREAAPHSQLHHARERDVVALLLGCGAGVGSR